jgi:hypothetical protein
MGAGDRTLDSVLAPLLALGDKILLEMRKGKRHLK